MNGMQENASRDKQTSMKFDLMTISARLINMVLGISLKKVINKESLVFPQSDMISQNQPSKVLLTLRYFLLYKELRRLNNSS